MLYPYTVLSLSLFQQLIEKQINVYYNSCCVNRFTAEKCIQIQFRTLVDAISQNINEIDIGYFSLFASSIFLKMSSADFSLAFVPIWSKCVLNTNVHHTKGWG